MVAQILLGAVLVLTHSIRATMGHFILSMVLLWNAVLLEKAKTDIANPAPL